MPNNPIGVRFAFKIPNARIKRGEAIENLVIPVTDTVNLGIYRIVWPQTLWGMIRINLIPIYPEIDDTPADWVPGAVGVDSSGGGSEHATFRVRLKPESVAGLPVTGKVRVTIEDVTRYPGYAMNASFGDGRDSPDLQVVCDAQHNTGWNCSYNSTDNKWVIDSKQELNSQSPGPGLELVVDSYDFAAYGKIKVELLSLESPIVEPQPTPPWTLGRGRVKDRPGEEAFTMLPIDRGEGQGTAGNKIADCGWIAEWGSGVHVDDASRNSADEDAVPSHGFVGDGLSVLEEYRGFSVNEEHHRTDPNMKNLFTYTRDSPGLDLGYFQKASLGFSIHRILEKEVYGINRINNNREGIPGFGQCAIRFEYCTRDPQYPEQRGWLGRAVLQDGIVHPAYLCQHIQACVYHKNIRWWSPPHLGDEETIDSVDALVVDDVSAHEAGHHLHVEHYEWWPTETRWDVMVTSPPPDSGYENDYRSLFFSNVPFLYDSSSLAATCLLNP